MGLGRPERLPLGAAMARSKVWDRFGTVFIVLINAVPSAIYYIFIQMYGTQLLGTKMLFDKTLPVTWILPLFSMALGNIAYYAMWLRRYMVDEMTHDYVKLARAKGVPTRRIMMKHVFRNAVVPMIQYLPTSLLYTVCGSIYIESLYSIPGMGGLLVEVISLQDNPMVQAIVMIYSCIGIVGLILGDLLMVLEGVNRSLDDIERHLNRAYIETWRYIQVRIGYWKEKIYRTRSIREIADDAFGRWRGAGRLDY